MSQASSISQPYVAPIHLVVPARPAPVEPSAAAQSLARGGAESRACTDCEKPLLASRTALAVQEVAQAEGLTEARQSEHAAATRKYLNAQGEQTAAETPAGAGATEAPAAAAPQSAETEKPGQLSEAEQEQVQSLKKTDTEVRRHEQAHANAGGQHAGSPQFEFEQGPDGKRYAVAGHVPIDVSPVNGDPKATIEKMDTVQRAATAPADPSSQDRAVAARAQQEKLKAQRELTQGDEGTDPLATAGQAGAKPDQANDAAAGAGGALPAQPASGSQRGQQQTSPLISLVA